MFGLISCGKEEIGTEDYREKITGDYVGIRVNTYWIDINVGYGHDTSDVAITLTASELDSIVDISFIPSYSTEEFSFKYSDGQFFSTSDYHPPSLTVIEDSLYFKHQAGLGPIWTEFFAKKLKLE